MRQIRLPMREIKKALPWIGAILLCLSFHSLIQRQPESDVVLPPEAPVLTRWFDTVVIDPGHGGLDEGASSHGLKEKDLTLDLSRKLAVELAKQGLKAALTRDADVYMALSDRVALANAAKHAIFLSLHCNFSSDPNAKGIEVYRCIAKSAGAQTLVVIANGEAPDESLEQIEEEYARILDDSVARILHADNRGEKRENFFVVRNIFYPALLVECGFLTNAEDAKRLSSEGYRQQFAQSLATGIINYRRLVGGSETKTVTRPLASGAIALSGR
jgi:N-acetylmuramoyl-L-alanine amidase